MRIAIAILVIVASVLAVYGYFVTRAGRYDEREMQQPWPMGLGPLAGVPRRFPPQTQNPSVDRFIELGGALGIDFKVPPHGAIRRTNPIHGQISNYITQEIMRMDDRLDKSPDAIEAFFQMHDVDIVAIRIDVMSR